jgi:hypothetical protein
MQIRVCQCSRRLNANFARYGSRYLQDSDPPFSSLNTGELRRGHSNSHDPISWRIIADSLIEAIHEAKITRTSLVQQLAVPQIDSASHKVQFVNVDRRD